MKHLFVCLTKLYRSRHRPARSVFSLSFSKSFLFFGAVLSIPGLVLSGSASPAYGQTTFVTASSSVPEQPDLPDAPSPSPASQQSSGTSVPFSHPMHSMDLGEKFQYLVEPAFGPRSFLANGVAAGIRMANPPSAYPHEWRSGAEAFGRVYGDSYARTGSMAIASFSTSVLLHEDPRYWRSHSTTVLGRLNHALLFTFVDKTDGGHTTIAMSNFTGAAAAGFIGNAYLPAGFNDLTHAGQRSSIAFGGLAAQNVLQEFAPEIGQGLRKIHISHIPLPPVWWTEGK
jgi:hypothetical protein